VSTKQQQKHRLVTRADFDGLVCAALLEELDLIDEIEFVHPKGVQDGKVEITSRDITTNLPYDPRCHLAFDHHVSESIRMGQRPCPANLVLDSRADSAARVVYRHYGGHKRFPNISDHLIVATDKSDAGRFTLEEVLDPTGWVLLNFIMDPRTGLGRFSEFRISNWEMLRGLVTHCRRRTVEEILALPDVAERVRLYRAHAGPALAQLQSCSDVRGQVIVLDLRNESMIYACNRFVIYALYPQCTSSVQVQWGRGGRNTVLAIGHSIFNRGSFVNVGELCFAFGGGGHANAGTIQVAHADAERALGEVVARLAPVVALAAEQAPEPAEAVPAAGAAGETDGAEAEVALQAANRSQAPEAEDPAKDTDELLAGLANTRRDIAAGPSGEPRPTAVLAEAQPVPPPDEERTRAERILEQTLAESGLPLIPTREEISRINERLDRIERALAAWTPVPTSN